MLVGTACAAGRVDVVAWRALAAGVVALALQVGTNYANDYSDGVRGTDSAGRRVGPVRLVGSGLAAPGSVKRAALAAFGIAALAGLALALAVGWELLVVGAAARWPPAGSTREGPTPTATWGWASCSCSPSSGGGHGRVGLRPGGGAVGAGAGRQRPVGFLGHRAAGGQQPADILGDTASGKRTLAVRLGDRGTRVLYVALLVGAVLMVPPVAGLGDRPAAAAALAAVPLALAAGDRGAGRRPGPGAHPGAGGHRPGAAGLRCAVRRRALDLGLDGCRPTLEARQQPAPGR